MRDPAIRGGDRQRFTRADRWTLAIVVATIVASIGLPLLGLRVFHAADVLLAQAPWRDAAPTSVRPTNTHVTDTVDAAIPLRRELQRRVADGDFPLWTQYPAGGTDLASVPNIGPLSPLNLPYLITPTWYAPALSKLIELFVAVGFTFLFLRRLGMGRPPALVGGLVFAFSGFQVVWTNWPQTHVGALIPALFWAVERGLDERTFRAMVPVSLVVAVILFEGFPAVAAYGLLAAGVYAVVRLVTAAERAPAERVRVGVRLAAAVVLGIGITALQLLPFLGTIEHETQERQVFRKQHLPISAVATFVIPDAFGNPVDRVYYTEPNYVEVQSFIGATAVLVIAASLLFAHRVRMPRGVVPYLWIVAGIAGYLIFVGGPPLQAFQQMPLLGTNFIGRLRSLLGFILAALVAVGLQTLDERPGADEQRRGPARWFRWLLVAGAAAGALIVLASVWDRAGDLGHQRYLIRQAALPAGSAFIALVGLAVGRRVRIAGRHPMLWIVPILVAAEAIAFAGPWWPRIPRSQFYPVTEVHSFLAENLGSDRFAAENRTMYPGTATYYGLRSVTAHAFLQPTWSELLEKVDPTVFRASRRVPFFQETADVATSPILDRLSVRYFVASPRVPVFGRRVAPPRSTNGSMALARGSSIEAPLPRRAPTRAVIVPLDDRYEGADGWLRVQTLDERGRIIGRGARRVRGGQGKGSFTIAVTEPEGRSVPAVRVRLELDVPDGSLRLARRGDRAALGMILAADDGLRVVLSGSAVVYQRAGVLPRIRWAPRASVIGDVGARIEALAAGADPGTVVLSAPGPRGSGLAATLDVFEDAGDAVRLRVRTPGDGYVVVADAMQRGWHASMDGLATTLVAADHAGVAVHVPAGSHDIVLTYRPAGSGMGSIISILSVLTLVGVVAVSVRSRKRPRERAS